MVEEIIQLTPAEKSLLVGVLSSLISTSLPKDEVNAIGDFLSALGSTLVAAVDQE